MKRVIAFPLIFAAIFWIAIQPSNVVSQKDPWKKVDEGLLVAEFDSPKRSPVKDSKIVIVKIDPKFYSFKLLCASEHGKIRLTARDWCQRHHLISAMNAGMYQKDGITNVGYMKNFAHVNNPRLNNTYKAVLAFNRTDLTSPEIQVIDLKCQDFEAWKPKYQTFVQNIRMLSCQQENVWAKQDKVSSIAALGMDKSENPLFIFADGPHSGHDLINILLSIPVSIYNAMYLEGGPEASLYFSTNGVELDKVGMFDTGLSESPVRPGARPIPNVIGIVRKKNWQKGD